MRIDVPFFKNSPDSTRCVLACMQMVLAKLDPENEYSFDALDAVVDKRKHMGVWHFAPLTYIADVAQKKGKRVVVVEQFPYAAFSRFPRLTCLWYFGWSAGWWQILLSALSVEKKHVQRFLDAFPECDTKTFSDILAEKSRVFRVSQVPTLELLTQFLDRGYLVMVNVNGYMIDSESGYGGHMVVVVGYTNEDIIIHNPRLPGSRYKQVPKDLFLRSWESPYPYCKNIYAVEVIH